TPGRSFTRPPRTSTIECSWRLWPMPGMYAVTSIPVVRRTRATLRRAEFGFFGVVVYTRVQTPRRCGDERSAGLFVLVLGRWRPILTSCWTVGMALFYSVGGFGPVRSSRAPQATRHDRGAGPCEGAFGFPRQGRTP